MFNNTRDKIQKIIEECFGNFDNYKYLEIVNIETGEAIPIQFKGPKMFEYCADLIYDAYDTFDKDSYRYAIFAKTQQNEDKSLWVLFALDIDNVYHKDYNRAIRRDVNLRKYYNTVKKWWNLGSRFIWGKNRTCVFDEYGNLAESENWQEHITKSHKVWFLKKNKTFEHETNSWKNAEIKNKHHRNRQEAKRIIAEGIAEYNNKDNKMIELDINNIVGTSFINHNTSIIVTVINVSENELISIANSINGQIEYICKSDFEKDYELYEEFYPERFRFV